MTFSCTPIWPIRVRTSIPRRWYSSKPPDARPYRSHVAQSRTATDAAADKPPEYPYTFLRRLFFPIGKPSPRPRPVPQELRDPSRGIKAAQEVAAGGKLPQRYRGAARRVTAIICTMPIVIYLSYELFQRQFLGKEQKTHPQPGPAGSNTAFNEGKDLKT